MHATLPLMNEFAFPAIERMPVETLQVNLGYKCNQTCLHCHVNAGPARTEMMGAETIEAVLEFLQAADVRKLDLTGGAPELNPHFRRLVAGARAYGVEVIDRCNLTILHEDGMEWLPDFFVEQRVELTCSLPCYTPKNVDQQRGKGVFHKSIEALRLLNQQGYGHPDSDLKLNLVYNPLGPYLPGPQASLEEAYRQHLRDEHGVVFNRLYTLTNMPISRFLTDLNRSGNFETYMALLEEKFNAATIDGLMCRNLVSVGWDGTLYDCDFNQMLDLRVNHGLPNHIREFDAYLLARREIRTGQHCYGCTAGSGSSCIGALQ